MAEIVLSNGIKFPAELDGLLFVRASPVDHETIAVLYSDAKGHWTHDDKDKFIWTSDPSGLAQIILVKSNGSKTVLPSFRVQSSWLRFAMLQDGGWIVSRHTSEIAEDFSYDSVIHSSDGSVLGSFNSGGAVGYLQTCSDGSFWIGHDDEDQGKEAKMGGLSFFSNNGKELLYSWFRGFEGDSDYGAAFWCCYALNIIGNTAWTQFYVPMYVSRTLPDGSQQHWKCLPYGAAALAVKNDTVALTGRYNDNQFIVAAYRLGKPPQSEFRGQLSFTIEGQKPKYIDHVEGRGDTIHIVHDKKWYRLTMDEILSSIEPASQ